MKTYRDELTESPSSAAQKPSWLEALRSKARVHSGALGFPGRHDESWRYLSLDPILNLASASQSAPFSEKAPLREAQSLFLKAAAKRLVFFNGRFLKNASTLETATDGLFLSDLETALAKGPDRLKPYLGLGAETEKNVFAAINTSRFKDAAVLFVPDHLTLEEPIHLLFMSGGSDADEVSHPRLLIVAGKCARIKVITDFVGLGAERFFSNFVGEVHLGEGACLDYFQIQRLGAKAVQFATHRYNLKGYATLNSCTFTQGGSVTRNEASVELGGEGGFASLKGLSILSGESQVFNHVTAHHKAPHGTSRQFFKNILGDKAKTEFNSLVFVPKGSQKSDSNQMSRNLLLSDDAQVWTRPQLRIDADDVQCVHGATVGQLQKEELFYLRSRGLSKKAARYLMTYGFAEEILETIPGDLRPVLEQFAQEELRRMISFK